MDRQILYEQYRPLLMSVAYRFLGSITDAEDIVQDIFLKLEEMDISEIADKKKYLIKMTANRCLNFLQSARKKREVYTGHWLPEPFIMNKNEHDPVWSAVTSEDVSYALLVMLETLSPSERIVFVLRQIL